MRTAEIDEITVLVDRLYVEIKGLSKEEQKKKCEDEILETLIMAYIFGFDSVESPIPFEIDINKMWDAIFLNVKGETFADRIRKHIDEGTWDKETMQRLVETEYHRDSETGRYDKAKGIYDRGIPVTKRWVTMMDDRVRETHQYLEGMEVGIDEKFYTYDGDSALIPGGFELPENNVNCRCELSYQY